MFSDIKRKYDDKVAAHLKKFYNLKRAVLEDFPAIQQDLNKINSVWIKFLTGEIDETRRDERIMYLRQNISEHLTNNGYDENVLFYQPLCPICEDKGYRDGKMCVCLEQMFIDEYHKQSNLEHRITQENFDTFNELLFSDDKQNGNKSPRENILVAKEACLSFVEEFDSINRNILFVGGVGTGKTFLTHCVAKELLERCKTVMYFTAYDLVEKFTEISLGQIDRNGKEMLWNCDLLIIDDLGCERQTVFSQNSLFNLLNERLVRNKSMLISTNLSVKELQQTYNERIFSRIMGNFIGIRFIGDDLRIKKKKQ